MNKYVFICSKSNYVHEMYLHVIFHVMCVLRTDVYECVNVFMYDRTIRFCFTEVHVYISTKTMKTCHWQTSFWSLYLSTYTGSRNHPIFKWWTIVDQNDYSQGNASIMTCHVPCKCHLTTMKHIHDTYSPYS